MIHPLSFDVFGLTKFVLFLPIVFSAWIASPNELDKGYLRFLDYHGGEPPSM
jgi:hypothetical protein